MRTFLIKKEGYREDWKGTAANGHRLDDSRPNVRPEMTDKFLAQIRSHVIVVIRGCSY